MGHSIQFPDQKEPFAVPHNGKEVDAQPRVQVTNLAMAGAVVNGAVADGMNALRVKFMQQATADARCRGSTRATSRVGPQRPH